MKTIWKFQLPLEAVTGAMMPVGATILSVQDQLSTLCAWALVESGNPLEWRGILIVGTGHSLPYGDFKHLGTFQTDGGNFVFHAFEEVSQ